MSAITDKRRELRREARERQRDTIPKLRALVRKQRKTKAARLAKCRADTKRRRAQLQRDAVAARKLLRLGIAAAKRAAQEAGRACKATATEEELDKIDRALAAVEKERDAIRELRLRAARLRDPRGRAGGKRRAELRAESDDEVRRNLADDRELAALWRATKNKARFKATPTRSRTEAFLEYVHDHPEALDELRSAQEVEYEREAAELLAQWPRDEPIGSMSDKALSGMVDELRRAEELTSGEVPF